MPRANLSQALFVSSLLLAACDDSSMPVPQAPAPADAAAATPAVAPVPDAGTPSMRAWFGDLHLHTGYSFDAAASATSTTPEDAYRYAQGEAVQYFGRSVQRRTPLDFLAVTDHSEYLGVASDALDPAGRFAGTQWPARLAAVKDSMLDFLTIFSPAGFRGEPPISEFVAEDLIRDNWQRQVDAAETFNRPGEFTTFVAFEWSPMLGGAHLHRNVIFRGPVFPQRPFSAIDSRDPADLWTYAEAQIAAGSEVLLIPHNSNLSQGLMFALRDHDGNAFDAAYAQRRSELERLVEITQIKGSSETRPEFSPTDEFAGFELVEWDTDTPGVDLAGGFIRTAYQRGLGLQQELGVNPFRFGLVGSSDFHSGLSSAEEYNFPGGLGNGDEQSDAARVLSLVNPLMRTPTTVLSASGLTGIWAAANTREALFDALKRREVFATSGPRLQVRLFAGWDYADDILQRDDWETQAYAVGVPMGADLVPASSTAQAPRFILQALKDPDSGSLDRIQMVKIWLQDGQAREQVSDVVWSGGRVPDADGKLPPVGNTVNLTDASYSNDIGATTLATVWEDPDFDPDEPALYYARVLEIPTPRWSTYLAVQNGLPLSTDVEPTLQERAWTSPVFYQP